MLMGMRYGELCYYLTYNIWLIKYQKHNRFLTETDTILLDTATPKRWNMEIILNITNVDQIL